MGSGGEQARRELVGRKLTQKESSAAKRGAEDQGEAACLQGSAWWKVRVNTLSERERRAERRVMAREAVSMPSTKRHITVANNQSNASVNWWISEKFRTTLCASGTTLM